MENFQKNLEKYAELTVKVALNIQKGQKLRINASIENAEFVQMVTRKAYQAGAKKVYVQLDDPIIQRITFEEAPEAGLSEFPDWQVGQYDELIDEGGAFLKIAALDPDLLAGIDPERIALNRKASGQALGRFQDAQTNGAITWCILSVPTKKWAAKIFPNLEDEEQMEALWAQIFKTTRIDTEDPVTAWNEHLLLLEEKSKFLNAQRFKTLHYQAPGTDLSIGLANDHLWVSAGFKNKQGHRFIPNVPTEEVFTMPHKDHVNGTVTSTKPLNYGGHLIENFSLTFKNGKVVDFQAEKGEATLKTILETDEGARHLGEVALVPHDSPISNSNLIFYHTLFDENASCHIALGHALLLNIKDAAQYSKEELAEQGYNQSITHVDFMIGSAELRIDGETHDGQRIPVFRNVNWAF